ncbi:MAG: ABC transporter permease [Eubacteriales bacterium]|nr:ABC transporter permease [Eubacteriales bacterium]
MSMFKLAVQNFKSSFKSYLSLIISLSFTTIILSNFINLVSSGILDQLGESQAKNIEISIQVLSFVIACFMLFFVWYATNVFLTKRKKEIGTYIFMGLSNQKIGKLYMIETMLIGIVSLIFGIGFGILTSQLFTMILMKLSNLAIQIHFKFTLASIGITCLIFMVIYLIFVIKGYVNIVRSSVLEMVSANRQNEYVRQKNGVLLIKAISGIILLGTGFYLATKEAGMEVMGNILIAMVMVIAGIYLLFGGFIPFVLQTLAKNKSFLYKKERNLWINNMIFRMKKNYRTYTMVCVLMLCSVTALGFGFAMKNRSDNINHFENTYTYQIMGDGAGYRDEFASLIQKENEIEYSSEIEISVIPDIFTDNAYVNTPYAVLSFSQIKQIAEDTGLEFELTEPEENEYIELGHLYLMSLAGDNVGTTNEINKKVYTSVAYVTIPYLGYFQEDMEYMIVNDKVYQEICQLGQTMYLYNYKLKNPENLELSVEDIRSDPHCGGLVKIDPDRNENSWINILFSVSFFVFMVFVLASGSILFMKIYNDAFEEKERYHVLSKIGIDKRSLNRAIANELRVAYIIPLLVMTIASFFSIKAIANLMQSASLLSVNILSVAIIYIFFLICYFFSKAMYQKNVE